jgi:hypothetical protein
MGGRSPGQKQTEKTKELFWVCNTKQNKKKKNHNAVLVDYLRCD